LVHASEPPQLKTASTHPIQYYLSLPEGWTATKKWPVIVVIESADREFSQAATEFAKARGSRPFIIVTPLVVTNGGAGFRSVPTYHYSDSVWDRVQNSGEFKFDMDGISAIMQDVVKQYGGEDKFFITGLEAAGHTIWGVLFNHPEVVRAAAMVCPNYLGRWVDEAHISNAPERIQLPIISFVGMNDTMCSSDKPIRKQITRAMTVASEHGYKNVAEGLLENKGHGRVAPEMLDYFWSAIR
jgi:poly(3-hydroxybutyrate) depolymerase